MTENREQTGRFKKGTSGNPGGRPKENVEVKEILKASSVEAARELVKYMYNKNAKIAMCAITEVLNRVCGKAIQKEEVEMELSITPSRILEAIRERENVGRIAREGEGMARRCE